MDQVFVQHRFTIKKDDGSEYSDAIVLPIDQYQALSKDEIDSLKKDRFNSHLQQLKDAQVLADNTDPVETINEDILNVDKQITDLLNYKSARQQVLSSISLDTDPILDVIVEKKGV